ncbi:hypothetical protein Fcan01_05330 [Folsomia candida]|uniref:OAR domain-containing protein n=1 Tax=Folsomia candida TaxID=158441 RepID=A0A226ESN6_FOLCA|nr:hypothetical protein Fcan01_05330 [Folsomia candida]
MNKRLLEMFCSYHNHSGSGVSPSSGGLPSAGVSVSSSASNGTSPSNPGGSPVGQGVSSLISSPSAVAAAAIALSAAATANNSVGGGSGSPRGLGMGYLVDPYVSPYSYASYYSGHHHHPHHHPAGHPHHLHQHHDLHDDSFLEELETAFSQTHYPDVGFELRSWRASERRLGMQAGRQRGKRERVVCRCKFGFWWRKAEKAEHSIKVEIGFTPANTAIHLPQSILSFDSATSHYPHSHSHPGFHHRQPQPYPRKLAGMRGCSPSTSQVWFQNRRAKFRKSERLKEEQHRKRGGSGEKDSLDSNSMNDDDSSNIKHEGLSGNCGAADSDCESIIVQDNTITTKSGGNPRDDSEDADVCSHSDNEEAPNGLRGNGNSGKNKRIFVGLPPPLPGSILSIIENGKSCEQIKSENNNINYSKMMHGERDDGNKSICSDDYDINGHGRHASIPNHNNNNNNSNNNKRPRMREKSRSKSRSRSRSRSNSRNCKSAESQSSGGSLSNHSLAMSSSALFPTDGLVTSGGFRPVGEVRPQLLFSGHHNPFINHVHAHHHHPLFPPAALKGLGLCPCCPPTNATGGGGQLSPTSSSKSFLGHYSPSSLLSSSGLLLPPLLSSSGSGSGSHGSPVPSNGSAIPMSISSLLDFDPRSSSVAELRRKAQEHSAVLLQQFHQSLLGTGPNPFLHFPQLPSSPTTTTNTTTSFGRQNGSPSSAAAAATASSTSLPPPASPTNNNNSIKSILD